MRKAIATFGYGPQATLLDVALPTFRWYAETHGYDLFVPAEQSFGGVLRPYPWLKVPLITALLDGGYDVVLWLDADVVVCRYDKDILEDAGGQPFSVVVHETDDGGVPNTGVWLCRQGTQETLRTLWGRDGCGRSDVWWEQAAFIDALGGDPGAKPVSVPDGPLWGRLPYEWNPHIRDGRGVPADCRFFHATMHPDRLAAMRERARPPL